MTRIVKPERLRSSTEYQDHAGHKLPKRAGPWLHYTGSETFPCDQCPDATTAKTEGCPPHIIAHYQSDRAAYEAYPHCPRCGETLT